MLINNKMNILKQLKNLDKKDLEYIYKELFGKNIRGDKKYIINTILKPMNLPYKFTVSNVQELQELQKERQKLQKERQKLQKERKKSSNIYNRTICTPSPEEQPFIEKIEKEKKKIEKEIKKIEKEIKKISQEIFKKFYI
tara:strand:- start:264 stop:683 length:420 start_codon:yes stop_codon:yes gene_type:complete